jgi:hypothetical protein
MAAKRDTVVRSRNHFCNIDAITRSACISELNATVNKTKILIYSEIMSSATIKPRHVPFKYFPEK